MAIIIVGNAFVSSGSGGGSGGSVALADCKGHVHTFGDDESGFYAVDPAIPDASDSKAILLGIPLDFTEIIQPTTTLDDRRVLYLFGSAWDDMIVAGVLLLGENNTRGAQLSSLMQWWHQNKVSRRMGPVRVSLGTTAVDAYVSGLRLDQADPQFNKQMFTIHMVTSDTDL